MSKKQNSPESGYSEVEVWSALHSHDVQYLEGRLLTVVDASIADPQQRKAVKDLVSTNIWDWFYNALPAKVEREHVKFPALILPPGIPASK